MFRHKLNGGSARGFALPTAGRARQPALNRVRRTLVHGSSCRTAASPSRQCDRGSETSWNGLPKRWPVTSGRGQGHNGRRAAPARARSSRATLQNASATESLRLSQKENEVVTFSCFSWQKHQIKALKMVRRLMSMRMLDAGRLFGSWWCIAMDGSLSLR